MIDDAVCPDRPMVPANDAGDRSETDPGAFEVSIAVETVEGVEEFSRILHVEAGAVIPDKPGALIWIPAEINDCMRNVGGELDRVA